MDNFIHSILRTPLGLVLYCRVLGFRQPIHRQLRSVIGQWVGGVRVRGPGSG